MPLLCPLYIKVVCKNIQHVSIRRDGYFLIENILTKGVNFLALPHIFFLHGWCLFLITIDIVSFDHEHVHVLLRFTITDAFLFRHVYYLPSQKDISSLSRYMSSSGQYQVILLANNWKTTGEWLHNLEKACFQREDQPHARPVVAREVVVAKLPP